MRRSALVITVVCVSGAGLGAGCSGDLPTDELAVPLAGGETTVIDRSSNAYMAPAPNLSQEGLRAHLEGDTAFDATFVSPPATVNAGLGPLFNNNGCRKCHVRDGRGLPVAGQGPLGSPLLVRVSLAAGASGLPGGPIPVPGLGTQFQDHAVHGATPEGTVTIEWVEVPGQYGDGAPFSLRRPAITLTLADGQPLPAEVMTSPRIPPPAFGLGLLEAVPDDAILALADPDDADGDGISGRANLVWDVEGGRVRLGRFGWKANAPHLRQQAAGAYFDDMGVSSPASPEADGSTDIDERTLRAVTFYTQTLAVPRRDAWDDPTVLRGEALFRTSGCAGCHVETLSTGAHDVAELVGQQIHPYTDLLLHDMGPGLADGRPDFLATGSEWRTSPLWGLGVAQTVLPQAGFLHDGRARTIEEAILWHGGEAERATDAFRALPAAEREALLAFLRSL